MEAAARLDFLEWYVSNPMDILVHVLLTFS